MTATHALYSLSRRLYREPTISDLRVKERAVRRRDEPHDICWGDIMV